MRTFSRSILLAIESLSNNFCNKSLRVKYAWTAASDEESGKIVCDRMLRKNVQAISMKWDEVVVAEEATSVISCIKLIKS